MSFPNLEKRVRYYLGIKILASGQTYAVSIVLKATHLEEDKTFLESTHPDTVDAFGGTVEDVVYALDAMYDIDTREIYIAAQRGKTPRIHGTESLNYKTLVSTNGWNWYEL